MDYSFPEREKSRDKTSESRDEKNDGVATGNAGAGPAASAEVPRFVTHIIRALEARSIDFFVGIPGGAISGIYDALLEAQRPAPVDCRHESSAAFMAVGYYRSTQKIPVVLVTSGPGVTNVLTGLACAHQNGARILVLAGEAATSMAGRGALQDGSAAGIDVMAMVKPITKHAVMLSHERAFEEFQTALDHLHGGAPGPVFVSMPMDIGAKRCEAPVGKRKESKSRLSGVEFARDSAAIKSAATLLRGAKRGLIMAGSGAAHPEAKRLLRRLAETLALPVATSPKGKGVFPEGHPLALGVIGYGGHRSAREYLDGGVDVILTVGCGLRETSTNGGKVPLHASKAMIRIDIAEQSPLSFYPADLNLLGESKHVLASLVQALGKKINPPKDFGGVLYNPIKPASEGPGLNPASVLRTLARALPPDTIWTSDIGEHLLFALHYLPIGDSSQFIADLGLGSMGTGIGAAIGAALGHPGRTVVCICGDYGFQMYGMELMTAAEQGANLICVVMNDAKMGMVVNGKEQIYGRSSPHGRNFLDIATIATSMGIPGRSVGEESEMLEALSNLPNGTSILDVDVRGQNRFGLVERVSMISRTMNVGAGAASKKGEQNGSHRRVG